MLKKYLVFILLIIVSYNLKAQKELGIHTEMYKYLVEPHFNDFRVGNKGRRHFVLLFDDKFNMPKTVHGIDNKYMRFNVEVDMVKDKYLTAGYSSVGFTHSDNVFYYIYYLLVTKKATVVMLREGVFLLK